MYFFSICEQHKQNKFPSIVSSWKKSPELENDIQLGELPF